MSNSTSAPNGSAGSHPSNPPAAQPQRPSNALDKYKFMAQFERKLAIVSWLAILAAGMRKLERFLGVCALTWASMVLLGGLISSLQKDDFHFVSILLLLEAVRFVAAVFFSNLVTRKLVTFSSNPSKRQIGDWVRTYLIVSIRIVALAGQMLLVSPSIVLPAIALHSLNYPEGTETSFRNVVSESLMIFYTLVLLNACIAAIAVLYNLPVSLCLWCLSEKSEESLQRYYDEVVWRGVSNGLLKANDFDLLAFAFEVQAQEYSRRVPPRVVGDKYANLIRYLLAEPTGVEVACNALESGDVYRQQAAANIVGFWTEYKEGKKIVYQTLLLSKLADRINMGQTGWAAANSFHLLGKLDARMVLKVENQRRKLVEILMDAVEPENGWSMVCVRALLPLVGKLGTGEVEDGKIGECNRKMGEILGSEQKRARERIQAGYALFQQERLEEKHISMLRQMKMKKGEYILPEEKRYLEEMIDDIPAGFSTNTAVKTYDQPKTPACLHITFATLLSAAFIGEKCISHP